MDDIKLINYHLQIQASCPHCDEKIIFLNKDIPEKNIIYRTCKSCKSRLRVKPFNVVVEVKKPNKPKDSKVATHSDSTKKQDTTLISQAKKAITSYGFSGKEVDRILRTINYTNMNLETLIKATLSKMDQNEQSTT
jgi:DNA-directed RNA polymerase subunit M/transcription elongation factor TFIIS